MKNKLLDLLACPYDGHFPLEMRIFEADDEIVEGILICSKCSRWYPIRDKIPEMLPDEMRNEKEEIRFLSKWKNAFPQKLTDETPFKLKSHSK